MKAERVCSEKELVTFARELALSLRLGDVLLLEGGLGAGKTTLAQKIIHALRPEEPATSGSPSFPIAFEIPITAQSRLIHVDLYRIETFQELEQTGVLDSVGSPDCIALVEWGSLFKELTRGVSRDSLIHVSIETNAEDLAVRHYRIESTRQLFAG